MPFEVESVVEALAADHAQVSLDIAVTFDVSIEKTLQCECFAADTAPEFIVRSLNACK